MGLLTYRLALAYEKLAQTKKSTDLFQTALKILELTHGKQHRLYAHVQRKLRFVKKFFFLS